MNLETLKTKLWEIMFFFFSLVLNRSALSMQHILTLACLGSTPFHKLQLLVM